MTTIRMPQDRNRRVRLAPHRFGQVGNMLIAQDNATNVRLELFLTDEQLADFVRPGQQRLRANHESRVWRAEALAS